jgi:erythromycin esterase
MTPVRWGLALLITLCVAMAGAPGCVPEVFLPPAAPSAEATPPLTASLQRVADPSRTAIGGIVRGPDGGGVDGALVAVVSTSDLTEPALATVSRGGGRFRFASLQPGTYAITATAPGLTAAYVDLSKIEAGKPRTGVKVKLGGEGLTVRGVVLDPAGQPVAGLPILLLRVSDVNGDVFLVRTDARGAYEVMLPKARYNVRVLARGMEPFETPTAGTGDETVDVSLAPAPGASTRRPSMAHPSAKSCTIAPLCAPR